MADLSFPEFVALLPTVRDGNSHFRLQVDVLRHGGECANPLAWPARAAAAAGHVVRTYYQVPGWLRPGLEGTHVAQSVRQARMLEVHLIRLEELPEAWEVVEKVLGRAIDLPWRTRTATDGDWVDLYDPNTLAAVGGLYRADVEAFGYEAP